MACPALSQQRGKVRLTKNNTVSEASYGCHENYLLPRSLPWETLVQGIQAFLVTRQIIAGAGKFALEEEDRFLGPAFQLSQRSDFISDLQSVDTMQRRPLVNTRDEPHANPKLYRRFHVIIGDANMSPFATGLKAGTTALVLEALVRDPRRSLPQLWDPLEALKSISRDAAFRWEIRLQEDKPATGLEIQRLYLNVVRQVCDLSSTAKAALVTAWENVLNDLERDVFLCRNRLDWVAKLALVREFQASQNLRDDDPWLRSLDRVPSAGCESYMAWNRRMPCWGRRRRRPSGTLSRSLPRQHALMCGAGAFKNLPLWWWRPSGTILHCKAAMARSRFPCWICSHRKIFYVMVAPSTQHPHRMICEC
jgi:proteasome accessory factor A